jgi:sugar O-acyltransferase (sialic acid O-acetyltransferase NeuD family)
MRQAKSLLLEMQLDEAMLLIGGGGHAEMLSSLFSLTARSSRLGYLAPQVSARPALKDIDWHSTWNEVPLRHYRGFVNGIGSSISLESRFLESVRAEEQGLEAFDLISPESRVFCVLTPYTGLQILSSAVLQPGVQLGRHVVVNTASVIEHDVEIGDGSFISPNATILGDARLQRFVFVGAGAVVLPGVILGEGSVVGAGAVVTRDVSPGETVVGVPARRIVKRADSNG